MIALLIAIGACTRGVNVGTTPTPVYAVAVDNATSQELIVSYDDGSGPRALGAVAAGRMERFIIASPARTTIQITGRSSDGSVTAGPVTVELAAGETRSVRLARPGAHM
jgi:hypothetical protein